MKMEIKTTDTAKKINEPRTAASRGLIPLVF